MITPLQLKIIDKMRYIEEAVSRLRKDRLDVWDDLDERLTEMERPIPPELRLVPYVGRC